MSEYTDKKINLILNRLSQKRYDELKTSGLINEDELYLIDSPNLDAQGNQILNVPDPISSSNAANKGYVDSEISGLSSSFENEINGLSSSLSAKADNLSVVHKFGYENINGQKVFSDSVTIGSRMENSTVGANSFTNGYNTTASGNCSHAEGDNTTASGNYSHAEGDNTTASGHYSHAEGTDTTASGNYSHTEGTDTTASGNSSHAEGYKIFAQGPVTHAEGFGYTIPGEFLPSGEDTHFGEANGMASHMEGILGTANGLGSHVEGVFASDNGHTGTFVWNGYTGNDLTQEDQDHLWSGDDGGETQQLVIGTILAAGQYNSHGVGTFNVNPNGGLNGFFIGEDSLSAILSSLGGGSSISQNYLPLSGGTLYGPLMLSGLFGAPTAVLSTNNDGITKLLLGDDASVVTTELRNDGASYQNILGIRTDFNWPISSGTLIVDTQLPDVSTKLDSTAAAPSFETSATYFVNEYVTKDGNLYQCISAITISGDWNPANWQEIDMTTPDATLDITNAGKLRVVGADGTILWQEGYSLDLSGTAISNILTLSVDSVIGYSFPVNSTDVISVNLPSVSSGKVGDLILDVMNLSSGSEFLSTKTYVVGEEVFQGGNLLSCNTAVETPGDWSTVSGNFTVVYSAFDNTATYSVGNIVVHEGALWKCTVAISTAGDWTGVANWQTASFIIQQQQSNTASIVVPAGEEIGDMLTFAPGTMCELYFTQTAFNLGNKPTWKVVRQDVTNGGAA